MWAFGKSQGIYRIKSGDQCGARATESAPHGLFITHKERLNENLIQFINQEVVTISTLYTDIST